MSVEADFVLVVDVILVNIDSEPVVPNFIVVATRALAEVVVYLCRRDQEMVIAEIIVMVLF